MLKTILIITCVSFIGETTYHPKNRNYCKIHCKTQTHTACDCTKKGERTEVELDKVVAFRKVVLKEHNRLRNHLASGNESMLQDIKASDMMAVSYDLELEYMGRCYLRSRFKGNHDECRLLPNGREAGQNLASVSEKDYSFDTVKQMINQWYEQILYMEQEWFNRTEFKEGVQVKYFTAMVWSHVNIIGCARLYTADPQKEGFIKTEFVQTLLCNYGITVLKDKWTEVNLPGRPVFRTGLPCSQCPDGYRCNSQYTALCGNIKPVPTDPAYVFSKSGKKTFREATIFLVTFALLYLY